MIVVEKSDALFLDFDGTLAPFKDDPAGVFLDEHIHDTIDQLARRLCGALALISGRDIVDLAERSRDSLWRIGSHGLEVCPPRTAPVAAHGTPPLSIETPLKAFGGRHEGIMLDGKGPVIALHYRRAPHLERSVIDLVSKAVEQTPGYIIQLGHKVVEAKPIEADKGRALSELMKAEPFTGRRPIMVGDDITDEDAFAAALKVGGTAIKVGKGTTIAPHRLPDPNAVLAWIKENATK